MTLYHGSYCEIKTPKIIKGKYTKDFGDGFYCTELKEQAERWCVNIQGDYNARSVLGVREV